MSRSTRGVQVLLYLVVVSFAVPLFSPEVEAVDVGQGYLGQWPQNYGFEDSFNYWVLEKGTWGISPEERSGASSLTVTQVSDSIAVRQDFTSYMVNQIKDRDVVFGFWFMSPYPDDDSGKAEIAYYCTSWISTSSSWVAASDEAGALRWTNVEVKRYIPTCTTQVYVKILADDFVGTRNVYSWFDDSYIALDYYSQASDAYGNARLGLRIWSILDTAPGSGYRIAQLSIASMGRLVVAPDPNGIEGIALIEIKMYLDPVVPEWTCWFDGWKTTQIGNVNLYAGASEANDKNRSVNPQDTQKARGLEAEIISYGLGVLTGFVFAPYGGPLVTVAVGRGTRAFLGVYGEWNTAWDPHADGGCDEYTQVQWSYYSTCLPGPCDPAPVYAGTGHAAAWTYAAGHGDYRLRIEGRVWWGEWVCYDSGCGFDPVGAPLGMTQYIDV